jgi:hypothetical protein
MMKTRVDKDMQEIFAINMLKTQLEKGRLNTQVHAALYHDANFEFQSKEKATLSEASESTVEPEATSEPDSFNDGGSDKEIVRQNRESRKDQLGGTEKKQKGIKNMKYKPRGGDAVPDRSGIANSSPESFAAAYGIAANSGIWKRVAKHRSSGDRRKAPKEDLHEIYPVGLVTRNSEPTSVDEEDSYERSGLTTSDTGLAQPCEDVMPLPKWFAPPSTDPMPGVGMMPPQMPFPNYASSVSAQAQLIADSLNVSSKPNAKFANWQRRDEPMPDCLAELVSAALEQGLIVDACRRGRTTRPAAPPGLTPMRPMAPPGLTAGRWNEEPCLSL